MKAFTVFDTLAVLRAMSGHRIVSHDGSIDGQVLVSSLDQLINLSSLRRSKSADRAEIFVMCRDCLRSLALKVLYVLTCIWIDMGHIMADLARRLGLLVRT